MCSSITASWKLSKRQSEPLYNSWIPPILKTVATEGKGIRELADEIARHAEHLREKWGLEYSRAQQAGVRIGCVVAGDAGDAFP